MTTLAASTASPASSTDTIRAARLHGPRDIRVDDVPAPAAPGPGEALVAISSVGVCGSDLHIYLDGHIGGTAPEAPLVLGHEFAGVVEAVGDAIGDDDAAGDGGGGGGERVRGGDHLPLHVGRRVAVDPAQPCGHCQLCETGHPNLCTNHNFCGLWPTRGAFCQKVVVPASTCFGLPEAINDEEAALCEPLGVALHAVDLGHVHVASSVAVIGGGPIGLMTAAVAQLAGGGPMVVVDRLPWRLDQARRLGATAVNADEDDPVAAVMEATDGRGVDVAFEAAWSDESALAQAVDVLRPGGRLVIVGIASDDRIVFQHSAVRRKGLTIALCRRMKHTYPRALALVGDHRIDLSALISHRFDLAHTADALATAADYRPGSVKVMVNVTP